MEIRVVMLGTAGSSPTKARSLPAVGLVYDGNTFLFDCGEGTQLQMLRYTVNSSKLRAIFISHAHGDHIIGIAGLVRTLGLNRRVEPLTIFVPKGSEGVIKSLVVFDKAMLGYNIIIKGIQSGEIYRGKGYTIRAFPLNHSIKSYGYVFREDDKRKFIVEKAKTLGLKGEMYSIIQTDGKIKLGKKIVKLKDVTTVQRGKAVVYASDTRPTKETTKAAKGAELLIHESSYADREKDLAVERMHSTALEVAKIAKAAKVKKLVLTHISARYNDPGILEEEARRVFKNSQVASDGDNIIV